jgi:hypothetical protein
VSPFSRCPILTVESTGINAESLIHGWAKPLSGRSNSPRRRYFSRLFI